jgi:hypothetical protein
MCEELTDYFSNFVAHFDRVPYRVNEKKMKSWFNSISIGNSDITEIFKMLYNCLLLILIGSCENYEKVLVIIAKIGRNLGVSDSILTDLLVGNSGKVKATLLVQYLFCCIVSYIISKTNDALDRCLGWSDSKSQEPFSKLTLISVPCNYKKNLSNSNDIYLSMINKYITDVMTRNYNEQIENALFEDCAVWQYEQSKNQDNTDLLVPDIKIRDIISKTGFLNYIKIPLLNLEKTENEFLEQLSNLKEILDSKSVTTLHCIEHEFGTLTCKQFNDLLVKFTNLGFEQIINQFKNLPILKTSRKKLDEKFKDLAFSFVLGKSNVYFNLENVSKIQYSGLNTEEFQQVSIKCGKYIPCNLLCEKEKYPIFEHHKTKKELEFWYSLASLYKTSAMKTNIDYKEYLFSCTTLLNDVNNNDNNESYKKDIESSFQSTSEKVKHRKHVTTESEIIEEGKKEEEILLFGKIKKSEDSFLVDEPIINYNIEEIIQQNEAISDYCTIPIQMRSLRDIIFNL